MIHHKVENDHCYMAYGVSSNHDCTGILVQTQDSIDQSRIVLNIHEAEHMISLLRDAIEQVKNAQGQKNTKWIGVDLDGTLAHYNYGDLHRFGATYIGKPVHPMVARVKAWIAEGRTVKIFTARIAEKHPGDKEEIIAKIEAWCEKWIGQKLEITNVKDYDMEVLYDDRAVQVRANTGVLVL